MKEYFVNPELKMSSGLIIFLMILFLGITSIALKLHHDRLKDNYIKVIGAVASKVIEENPKLEKEIIPLITKEISKEDSEKGIKILKKYGLTKELEDQIFPYIDNTVKMNNYCIILVFIFMSVIFFLFNYFQYVFFYKKIRNLTMCAKKVVEGDYDLAINENIEGDFSKLSSSFNSMRGIIRSNITALKNEKQFLVDLLSDISHQLKTPLSSMVVYNDILLSKELTKEQSRMFLTNNQNQLKRMNWLIKSILKLAKLDAGAIEFVKENVSLNESIEESVDVLKSKSIEGNIEIIFNESTEIFFEHDKLWMEEAFINIIKNGIEHTLEGGKITITIIENPIYRRIIIEDTGEGIKESDLPNIFKRFYRAKTSRKTDSVGIGLALAKSIIEAHNGFIEVQSKVGIGTKFIITFLKY
ncbi:ATP-binding protein [Clostridium thailandense]|uniref:HAMP domain-containing sensor histidine kinase n=1 Tax=Clostridium thailandense TaxID=2794346 RepID=UPI003989E11C